MSAWDIVLKENSSNNSEVEFVKTPNGTTRVRILDSEPKAMWKHWINQANGGKGMSVICIGKDKCPVCKADAELVKIGAKKKYGVTQAFSMNALVKVEEEYKVQILEKGKTLFKSIHTIMSMMGELKGYELNIIRSGEKMQDITYQVIPQYPAEALKQEDEEKYMAMRVDLNDYYKTLTPEEITILMEGGVLTPKENEEVDFSVEE